MAEHTPEDIERRARRIAARKMGLVRDFYGELLPDDLWHQCVPEAWREANAAMTTGQTAGKCD